MLNKEVSKTYQIQIREWREIQNILFMIWPILNPHADSHQNFRISLVPSNFIYKGELILTIAAQCKIVKQGYYLVLLTFGQPPPLAY